MLVAMYECLVCVGVFVVVCWYCKLAFFLEGV